MVVVSYPTATGKPVCEGLLERNHVVLSYVATYHLEEIHSSR